MSLSLNFGLTFGNKRRITHGARIASGYRYVDQEVELTTSWTSPTRPGTPTNNPDHIIVQNITKNTSVYISLDEGVTTHFTLAYSEFIYIHPKLASDDDFRIKGSAINSFARVITVNNSVD